MTYLVEKQLLKRAIASLRDMLSMADGLDNLSESWTKELDEAERVREALETILRTPGRQLAPARLPKFPSRSSTRHPNALHGVKRVPGDL